MRFVLAMLSVLGAAAAHACPGLQASDTWIREAPPGSMMTVAYAKLRNAGTRPLRITGGFSADFAGAELHRTVVENGLSRMVDGDLDLPPGGAAALEPGSWHLMLMKPARALRAGDQVRVAFQCGKQASEFTFTVKAGTE
jgi:copper(I)-binding protein